VIVGLGIGLVIGALVGLAVALLLRSRHQADVVAATQVAQGRLADARALVDQLSAQLEQTSQALGHVQMDRARIATELDQAQRVAVERESAWEKDRERLTAAFAQLSSEALARNNEQFLTLAETRLRESQEVARGELGKRQEAISQMLGPLQETLIRYEKSLQEIEVVRQGAYSGLSEQIRHLSTSHDQLQRETRNLVTALRAPQTRGRWGEMQLRRAVEMAGMVPHCDFDEQVTTTSDERRLRPDLVMHLPGGAHVVVDAKVPLDAFLRAIDAEDDVERQANLTAHARQLRNHVDQLSKREYWQQFEPSPDFVVAFVPGDPLLAAALEHDLDLFEHAMANRVLIATPTTLIALLRTVAHGWQQEALADNARAVQQLGSELYDRLRVFGNHFAKMQRSLNGTVEAFNDAVGSLESRVLVTARRFPELGVVTDAKEVTELRPVTLTPRAVQAPDLALASEVPLRPMLDVVGSDESDGQESADEGTLPGIAGFG
jgi:DNA recombination protein RmuC